MLEKHAIMSFLVVLINMEATKEGILRLNFLRYEESSGTN